MVGQAGGAVSHGLSAGSLSTDHNKEGPVPHNFHSPMPLHCMRVLHAVYHAQYTFTHSKPSYVCCASMSSILVAPAPRAQAVKKTRKEVMEEIIAKSKFFKVRPAVHRGALGGAPAPADRPAFLLRRSLEQDKGSMRLPVVVCRHLCTPDVPKPLYP